MEKILLTLSVVVMIVSATVMSREDGKTPPVAAPIQISNSEDCAENTTCITLFEETSGIQISFKPDSISKSN